MPKLQHFDNAGTARFVTFTCFHRRKYLNTPVAREIVIQGLIHLRTVRHIKILGWVLMPEHVHLVLLPPDNLPLGESIGRFKNWTSRLILGASEFTAPVERRGNGRPAFWQKRCFDHNCRTTDVVRRAIEYCHNNPVKRGLVEHLSDWPWSSYNWYCGEGRILLEIDGLELT